MRITYIFHSGFLVEADGTYYLFDYYRGELPALDSKKPIVVMSSHAHPDHYNPAIFPMLARMGMQEITAVLAKDIPSKRYPPQIAVLTAEANSAYALQNGARLETLRSTDRGVAYLLTTAQGVIYHAGDLNDWTWEGEDERENRQMRGNYRHEIDKLAGRCIDVAFLPLDPRQESHYADGILYFLERVGAARVYPMHLWEQPAVVDRFLAEYPQYCKILGREG